MSDAPGPMSAAIGHPKSVPVREQQHRERLVSSPGRHLSGDGGRVCCESSIRPQHNVRLRHLGITVEPHRIPAERERAIHELEQHCRATLWQGMAMPAADEHARDGVSIAELPRRATLVRVSGGTWDHFVAWRYGRHFVKRRRSRWTVPFIGIVVGLLPPESWPSRRRSVP